MCSHLLQPATLGGMGLCESCSKQTRFTNLHTVNVMLSALFGHHLSGMQQSSRTILWRSIWSPTAQGTRCALTHRPVTWRPASGCRTAAPCLNCRRHNISGRRHEWRWTMSGWLPRPQISCLTAVHTALVHLCVVSQPRGLSRSPSTAQSAAAL